MPARSAVAGRRRRRFCEDRTIEPLGEITIRPATPTEAGELLALQRGVRAPEAQLHGGLFIPPLTQAMDELRTVIAEQTVLVAVAGHRIVGTVRVVRAGQDWCVGRLGIIPDLQGGGLGRRLLAAIGARAPQELIRFTLTTGPRSVQNIAFSERHGDRRVPGDDGLVNLAKEVTGDRAR